LTTKSSTPEIPGFVLDRLLGEGGFGQVWRATRQHDSLVVAIKVLHFELVSSNDAMVRFQRELAAIARLHHRSVVRALDDGTLVDGRPYVVLEYLDGPSLREVIRDRGVVAPEDLLAIIGPVCDALTVAHAASLVHRDIKASNVVLARDEDGLRPVLLDFGLVKLLDDMGPGLTSSRTMLGTPTAMAPEQMRGEPVDPRTDVYALGLLAYHMLTGQPAFTAGGGAIKSYLQLHGPRPRPSAKIDIDPRIDGPIMKALAPVPSDRYASAAEFLYALAAVIKVRAAGTSPVPKVSPILPADTTLVTPPPRSDVDVLVLYAEGGRGQVARVRELAEQSGMTIAISAPDSVLAVIPLLQSNPSSLRTTINETFDVISIEGTIALGRSRASIRDGEVDGPALDVESWAPYPLERGLWISPAV